jgi:hypothetical protein
MNTLKRSVVATLALTVSASLGLNCTRASSTDATTSTLVSHISHRQNHAAAVHVRVTVRKHRITRSNSGFRPGNTVFDLRSVNGGVAVQLLRLRRGYTFTEFWHDNESDGIKAIRRIDRKVVFYGGMPAYESHVSHFGTRLDPGRYFLIDFDHPRRVRLRVEGTPERRSVPNATGTINMVMDHREHRFQTPWRLPRSGWLRQTNRTDEPHFMVMIKVKHSTTRKQVRRAFAGQGPQNPTWLLHEYQGTYVISPGRTVVWRYTYPRGKYLEACFWPSDEDGTTHAEMGMWNFITLH